MMYSECFFYCTRAATINLGDDVPDPGIVEDGSPCETDRKLHTPGICLNRKCVPVGNIKVTTCPADSNGTECSGNGVRDKVLSSCKVLVKSLELLRGVEYVSVN